jgi:hypothetical protein
MSELKKRLFRFLKMEFTVWLPEEEIMLRPKCPTQEKLLEFHTIPQEINFFESGRIKYHLLSCECCTEKLRTLKAHWQQYFAPEPDVTSSLMRVYSRLQKDETLILKGWKLNETRSRKNLKGILFSGGWLFRGAVSLALAAVVISVVITQQNNSKEANTSSSTQPFAQIRMENKNGVKVHYLQPELLQTIEFETTRGK